MKKLIVALMLVPAMAQAEFRSGNRLLEELQSPNLVDRSYALGYVAGAADVMQGTIYCPPKGITMGQVNDTVLNFIATNPTLRHYSADSLIANVLKSQWPCANRGRGA